MAKGGGLVADGGSRPCWRKGDERSWSETKRDRFFATLADSCNVKMAAIAAGVSPSTVYLRRQKDAAFRAGWDQALAEGYAKLELELLKRALHGAEKTITRGGETSIMHEYNDRVALALLRMHRETAMMAGESIDGSEHAEACERIVERIERIREQAEVAGGGAPGGESERGVE